MKLFCLRRGCAAAVSERAANNSFAAVYRFPRRIILCAACGRRSVVSALIVAAGSFVMCCRRSGCTSVFQEAMRKDR